MEASPTLKRQFVIAKSGVQTRNAQRSCTEHHNGHQICLTYNLNLDDYHSAISYSKLHQNGSVCIKSKIIRGQISNKTNITDSNTTEKLSRSDMSPMVVLTCVVRYSVNTAIRKGVVPLIVMGRIVNRKSDAQKCQEPRPCVNKLAITHVFTILLMKTMQTVIYMMKKILMMFQIFRMKKIDLKGATLVIMVSVTQPRKTIPYTLLLIG